MDREFKGKSTIALPVDYVVIDTETTGLDFEWCSIIEVSAIRYENNAEVARFSSLVKPPLEEVYFPFREEGEQHIVRYVDDFIADLTGITNEMLESAPEPDEVIPQFLEFIGDSVLIGHNVSFDVNFLYDAAGQVCEQPLKNDHINTVRIARKVFPECEHYRLSDVAEACQVLQGSAHRALADCEVTAACYQKMRSLVLENMTEEEFQRLFKKSALNYTKYIEQIDLTSIVPDEESPLFGKTVVFTGTLEKMPRKQALDLVAKIGGMPSDSLTKATNYLVVGNGEFVKSVKDGKSSKMKKAEAMALKGVDIRVISESAFWNLVNY